MTRWVFAVAWPHARQPVPARPCVECGADCPPRRRGRCAACYMRWYRRQHGARHQYYYSGQACARCGLVPGTDLRRSRLTRGVCRACYMQHWRWQRKERVA